MIFVILILFFQLVETIMRILQQFWLGYWGIKSSTNSIGYFIGIFWCFAFIGFIWIFLKGIFYALFNKKLSIQSHMSLVKRLLHAPLNWFDKTPIGRIISRTSNDQGIVDK